MNAAVFLDRDNTIIHNDGDLGDPEGVKLIQGAASAIASLRGLNYKIIVVTNQGGVARGKYTEDDVQKTNQRVADLVRAASGGIIDRFYYCPFHPQGTVAEYCREHEWRKPAPGMLLQAARDLQIDLSQSWMVGDQMRDVQAGVAAGTRAILLRADAQELQPLRGDQMKSGRIEVTGDIPHFTARNLIEAVRIIAQQRKPDAELAAALQQDAPRKKWDPAAVKAARLAKASEAAGTQANPDAMASDAASSTKQPAAPMLTSSTLTRTGHPWTVADAPAIPLKGGAAQASNTMAATATASPAATSTTTTTQIESSASSSRAAAKPAPVVKPTLPAEEGDDLPPVEADHETGPRTPSAEMTLRQILQELRSQRHVHSDFSYVRMIAVVMQIVAAFLLVAGLLLGAEDADVFVRWVVTAILAQLATIALLLFAR